jgi:hypothetical protein
MSLFQTSVVKKYLNDLSPELIDKKYKEFQSYFGNAERQENIRNSKEEEYQSGFINALFVNILGYTLNPEPNFNIVLEKKNVDDSKKADGAILKDDNVIAVIELKSTKTTDLDTIETQAFGYKNHHSKCQYIITSNFEKIRIYIQNAIDHLEFDLFNLSKEDFALLWLCLSKDNILQNIPLKIKEASVLQEENVTKKLYKDYSKFREEIFANIVKNNPEFDKLVLFKKTQKLLDRFLFIFFAEDRLLVPPNSINQIVDKWKDDVDFGDDKPLYSIFKQYFHVLNVGRPKSGKRQEIFAYNGGLFLPDEILDNIKIDDEVLHQNTLQLSTYDFETEVDVNILGHIFEHSLGEIENVQAEIAGEVIDKQKTKRKKDGIFYTPKYITKYIVENTVGKLCNEKRAEFGIIDEEYAKGRRKRKKDIIRDLDNKLTEYRKWLLEITILDPACGSGAFLNQALEFLILEHKKVDELKAQLLGGSIVFPDIEAKILEKNIYGVDLNEESVEIAKLSLWLRTAQKGRKLTILSNNIKCGNSLIDDPEIAGEKAFNWQNEFPEVFAKGGFDVVIGNPPYLGGRDWKDADGRNYQFFISNYEVAEYQFDMYVVFWERGIKLIRKNGLIGFITPNTWLNNLKTEKLRKFVLSKTSVLEIADYSEVNVFEDAVVLPVIFILKNSKSQSKTKVYIPHNKGNELYFSHEFSQQYWLKEDYCIINIRITEEEKKLNNKIETGCKKLENIAIVKFGVKLYETGKGNPPQLPEFSKNHIYESNYQVDGSYRKYLEGKDVNTYSFSWENRWLKYGGNLAAPRDKELFEGARILVRRITGERLISTFIEENFVTSQLLQIVKPIKVSNAKWLLAILNSSLIAFFFKRKYNRLDKAFPEIRIYELRDLPIKEIESDKEQLFNEKVNNLLKINKESQILNNQFKNLIQGKFELKNFSSKILKWYDLNFEEYLKELKRVKVKLSLSEEAEWMDYFKEQKEKVQILKTEIDKIIKEIDQMVYELYGLTDEEIKIVENEERK